MRSKKTRRQINTSNKDQARPSRLAALIVSCALLQQFIAIQACLRPISIEQCGYVVAIGVDEGHEDDYEFTFELQREAGGDAQSNSGGAIILSCEARDVFAAVSKLAAGIAYDLNFTRTHLFIFGENLAKSGAIEKLLNMSFDVLRIRKSALMLITRCKVRDYLGGLASNNNANIAKMQDALISNVEMTGETAALNVSLFFEAVNGGRFDPVMPIGYFDESIITDMKQRESEAKGDNPIADAKKGVRTGGMQGLTVGCALFDAGKLCGELSGTETQFMNLVRGDYRRGTIAYPLEEGGTASLLAVMNKRSIKVDTEEENPRAKVWLELNITIEMDPMRRIGEQWRNGEKEKLEQYFENELANVFFKCKEIGCDAMGFGRSASMNFCSTELWEAYSWKTKYGALEASFEVELNLDDEYLADRRQ